MPWLQNLNDELSRETYSTEVDGRHELTFVQIQIIPPSHGGRVTEPHVGNFVALCSGYLFLCVQICTTSSALSSITKENVYLSSKDLEAMH